MRAQLTSIGRRYKDKHPTLVTDPFLDDYVRIVNSRAFRRLAYKTQVLSLPQNPHVRSRLTHTNEVMAISLTIAEQLGLNKNLCMAIAAGHDIGHTPYGHVGESILSDITGVKFKHTIFSVVVAQHIENACKGLNLTYEVLEGISLHSRSNKELSVFKEKSQEYSVVMFADKIAYTFSDLNDSMRYGYLSKNNLPDCAMALGKTQQERINSVIEALIKESKDCGYVNFSKGRVFQRFDKLKKFMYENVYFKIDRTYQELEVKNIYNFFKNDPHFEGVDPSILVAMLSDVEIDYFGKLMKSSLVSVESIKHFGIFEVLPKLKRKEFDYMSLDLNPEDFSTKNL